MSHLRLGYAYPSPKRVVFELGLQQITSHLPEVRQNGTLAWQKRFIGTEGNEGNKGRKQPRNLRVLVPCWFQNPSSPATRENLRDLRIPSAH